MDIERYIVSQKASIRETMQKIDTGARGIAFVCEAGKLYGVVTDGDIRRHLLKGGTLEKPVMEIANKNPIALSEDEKEKAQQLMREKCVTAIPIIDKKQKIVDIFFLQNKGREKRPAQLNVPLVIMAGGKGTRLKPYTDILPKPLIPVGEETITERIMDKLEVYGCDKVYMIVNYKKNFIKAYFGDSTDRKRDITFIDEETFLGTGGGLKLLEEKINSTFFMSNCDILLDVNYEKILRHHKEEHNLLTMICACKKFEIPYGTINLTDEGRICDIREKPSFEYYVNTGFYVIEPDFLKMIPADTFIHITDVIKECISRQGKIGSYLIDEEDWMDMGQMDEYTKMKKKLGL